MNKLCCLIVLFVACKSSNAQINIQCNGPDLHSIYLYIANPAGLYRVDSVDTSPTNPILLTTILPSSGSAGISINANLDSIAGPETMYFVNGNGYYFWNGVNWTYTGHTSGNFSAINPGGTSNYIFNLYGGNGSLYRYDGTGNGILLLSNLNTAGGVVFDVATDNQGNFYLFYTSLQKIIAYNSIGMAIDSFTTTGFVNGPSPGFAILNDRMYVIAGAGYLYEGIKTGNNINFTLIKNIGLNVNDIAACSEAGNPLSVFKGFSLPQINVYPNPIRNELNILADNIKSTEFILYDISSRNLLQKKFTNTVTINTEELAKGIYLYEVRNKNGVIKKGKVIKQ